MFLPQELIYTQHIEIRITHIIVEHQWLPLMFQDLLRY